MADDLNEQMRALTKAVERANQLAAKASVGSGSGGIAARAKETSITARAGAQFKRVATGRALGGGLPGLAAQGALGVGLAGAGLAGQTLASGAVQAARGGSFQGGAGRSLISAAASVPFLGEALGFNKVAGTLEGAQGDLNQVTNQVARFAGAGAITPKVRDFLADRAVVQNKNIQDDREKNKNAINQPGRLKLAAAGEDAPLKMLAALDGIRQLLESIAAGFPGGSN